MGFFLLALPDFTDPSIWLSLLTLTFLEIILGVDNIIFISIVANKLPKPQQKRARTLGLAFALIFRIILLLGITWLISLTAPLFFVPWKGPDGLPLGISWRDLILIAGGMFLIYKSTAEVHEKLEGVQGESQVRQRHSLPAVITQIVLVDMVFSFDSILTAVGLVDNVAIMIMAVMVSIGIMMVFAGPISEFINARPTVQVLALTFLVLIGFMLIVEGFHQHVPKGYIYFAIAYAMGVEMLNQRVRKKNPETVVQLHGKLEDAVKEGLIDSVEEELADGGKH